MKFHDQYKHPNWQRVRLEALEAAEFRCQRCGDDESQLHVHHRQYFKDRLIWEYSLSELEVLCDACHAEAHEDLDDLKRLIARIPVDCLSEITSLVKGYASMATGPIVSAGVSDDGEYACIGCFITGQIAAVANDACSIVEMESLRDQLKFMRHSRGVVSIDIKDRRDTEAARLFGIEF